jgi:His-Xaa-Ser system protein HxsD
MPKAKKVSKKKKKSVKKAAAKKLPVGKPAKALLGKDSVTLTVPVKENGLDVVLGSAYQMTDRYFVALGGDRKKQLTVTLTGKTPLKGKAVQEAADLFQRELATQRVRWQIARENIQVREYVQELAVKMAQEPPPAPDAPATDELSADQRSEIDALISEVESEIKELKKTPAGKDPKNISASWEEKHKA